MALAAPILSIQPPSQPTAVGTPVSVDVMISDLGDGVAPSMGSFQIDVLFDPLILMVSSVTFGDPILGDQLDLFGLGSLSFFDDTTPGQVSLTEVSFDSEADLDALQAPSFVLAQIVFDVIAVGGSAITIANEVISDAAGLSSIPVDVVNAGVTVIPEPATLSLAAFGLLALGLYARKKRAADRAALRDASKDV